MRSGAVSSLSIGRSGTRQGVAKPRRLPRAGLTLVEVLVAAAILSVAAVAALELLASTDLAAREARRQALASVEAERALEIAADALARAESPPRQHAFGADDGGESLAGCVLEVRSERAFAAFTIGGTGAGATPARAPVVRLVAEVLDRDGRVIAAVERIMSPDGSALVIGSDGAESGGTR